MDQFNSEEQMVTKQDEDMVRTPDRVGGAVALGRRQMELMAHVHQQLFQQIENVNQAWLDSVKRTKDSEIEFTRSLSQCEDPAKAAELCAEWMRTRAAAFLAESQRFSGLWLDFYSNGMKAAFDLAPPDIGRPDAAGVQTSEGTPASA